MAKLSAILQERFKKKEQPKISELAEKRGLGQLTAFSGLFGTPRIDEKDRLSLSELLNKYTSDPDLDLTFDLSFLLEITAEVKAINNQAAILHGERIKRAQEILKKYREGAFSAWLIATYGNRQTPYNFLLYYEFYSQIPTVLHSQLESMPKQAIYTLASRKGTFSQKEEIVRNYKGESKQEMVLMIRSVFPLDQSDKRRENLASNSIKQLEQLVKAFKTVKLDPQQKARTVQLLEQIRNELIK